MYCILEIVSVVCRKKPDYRKSETKGMEGYEVGEYYFAIKVHSKKDQSVYWLVYHEPDAYYETCTSAGFKKHFTIDKPVIDHVTDYNIMSKLWKRMQQLQ